MNPVLRKRPLETRTLLPKRPKDLHRVRNRPVSLIKAVPFIETPFPAFQHLNV
jgi:hypothetical protein